MKLKLLTILLTLSAILSMTMVSCKNQSNDSSSDVVGADGVTGGSDIKVGAI